MSIQSQAQKFLQPGETVIAVTRGYYSFLALWILGLFAHLGAGRVVVLTNRNIHLYKTVLGRMSLIETFPREAKKVELRGLRLQIGDRTIFIAAVQRRSAKRF